MSARLLLVDDDEAACRLLSEVLEREEYRVVSALSADEAIAKLDDEGPFDAVLTDLRMPRKSGLDLLRVVRGRDPDALVLVLTAFGDAAAAGEAIRAGAYDFISKPYARPWIARWCGVGWPAGGPHRRTWWPEPKSPRVWRWWDTAPPSSKS
jgi:DNA-binding NtrC family response regulator